jgi:hypothetical protein
LYQLNPITLLDSWSMTGWPAKVWFTGMQGIRLPLDPKVPASLGWDIQKVLWCPHLWGHSSRNACRQLRVASLLHSQDNHLFLKTFHFLSEISGCGFYQTQAPDTHGTVLASETTLPSGGHSWWTNSHSLFLSWWTPPDSNSLFKKTQSPSFLAPASLRDIHRRQGVGPYSQVTFRVGGSA